MLVNHLKSKGHGDADTNNERRRKQAARMNKLYEDLVEAGEKLIAAVGDFNDTPDSKQLDPLLGDITLKDAFKHPDLDLDI